MQRTLVGAQGIGRLTLTLIVILVAFISASSQAVIPDEKSNPIDGSAASTDEQTKPKPADPVSSPTPSPTKKEKRGRFVIAPIPIFSPAVESGAGRGLRFQNES